ncbi:flagellar basal body rod protein FlgB [Roseivivax isoporae]|uniref:Flagellar basal body rod protein FlgB n=1 Tax=Roseivivax isoporae LMG 25204 TaxID=1449351 RepID=X7F9Z6_9RHOB|nr:flagellar basal body protein [Roseivivax isoporae]ETX28919.1 hypothetical protein RISW2_04190 [Roseivivax isoporae LMG 25204]
MNIGSLSFFELASERLRWLAAKQEVVSQNIANANTPGYRARDVAAFDDLIGEGSAPARTGLAVTRAGHIEGAGRAASGHATHVDRDARVRSIDGNTVALEEQMIVATDTEESYRLAADLYRKGHDMMILAIGGRR